MRWRLLLCCLQAISAGCDAGLVRPRQDPPDAPVADGGQLPNERVVGEDQTAAGAAHPAENPAAPAEDPAAPADGAVLAADSGAPVVADTFVAGSPADAAVLKDAAMVAKDSTPSAPAPVPNTKILFFSPSPRQADYGTRFDADFQGSWDGIRGAYDVLNLHFAGVFQQSDAYLAKIKERVGNKAISVELQSTAGLLHFQLQKTGSCDPALDAQHAYSCGQMAADALYNGGSGGLSMYRLKQHGLNVTYLMLDSAFYAPYFHIGYHSQNGTLHTEQGKLKAIAFMNGFMDRMRAADKWGSALKFIMISHFKYEYVAGNPGFINHANQQTCFNTCTPAGKWIDEDAMVDYVLTQLPGRFDMVLFDASWSSFYVTPNGWLRWEKMIDVVNRHNVKAGNMIMTDMDLAQPCADQECWISADDTCYPNDEATWWTHALSYIHTVTTGSGMINNFGKLDAMMIASWHRLPRSTFRHNNVCSIPMEDILRCAANAYGRSAVACPTH